MSYTYYVMIKPIFTFIDIGLMLILDTALRANKSETFDWLKFRLEGEGERTHGNAFTDATFTGYRI
jgi:hypothetical protein